MALLTDKGRQFRFSQPEDCMMQWLNYSRINFEEFDEWGQCQSGGREVSPNHRKLSRLQNSIFTISSC